MIGAAVNEKAATSDHAVVDAGFQKRIDAGQIIEPRDDMPQGYRRLLLRQISQHAHSEIIGQLPEANWITRAPTLQRKLILIAKVQDEAGHGLYLYCAAETLGESRDQMMARLHSGDSRYSSIFNYPTLSWADIGMIGWLVDTAAIINQIPLQHCSYGPYARAMRRICREESFHMKQGLEIMKALCRGNSKQRAMAQDALDRWWWPSLMMFGPSDRESTHSEQSMKWRIKQSSNDSLRQKYVDQVVPQANLLGLIIPDEKLIWNSDRGSYDYGPIDWDEFNNVLAGKGPCNRERLGARIRAWEKGAWFREGLNAWADKKNALQNEAGRGR